MWLKECCTCFYWGGRPDKYRYPSDYLKYTFALSQEDMSMEEHKLLSRASSTTWKRSAITQVKIAAATGNNMRWSNTRRDKTLASKWHFILLERIQSSNILLKRKQAAGSSRRELQDSCRPYWNVFVLTMVCNIFTNRFYFSYSSFRSASSFPLSAFQKLLVFCVVLVYVYPVMRGEFLLSWKLLLLCRSKCGFPFRYSVNVYVLRWPCRLNPGCLGGPGNYYFRLCTSSRGALFVVFLITWSCLIFFVAQ